jgi:hypothetical protein
MPAWVEVHEDFKAHFEIGTKNREYVRSLSSAVNASNVDAKQFVEVATNFVKGELFDSARHENFWFHATTGMLEELMERR